MKCQLPLDWQHLREALVRVEPFAYTGWVEEMVGLLIRSRGPKSPVGGVCRIEMPPPQPPVMGRGGGISSWPGAAHAVW